MPQSYVAWYQLISSHPTSCVAVCWRLDGPDPCPQGPPIPQGGAGYHCSIYILNLSTLSLRYLIWSSFQYLILTYILVTYILVLPEINFLHLILPVTLLLLGGWLTPASSQGPPIPQGEGGWWVMTMTMAGGVGGGPGTWSIYIYIYIY